MACPSSRKRRASDTAFALERVQELSIAAGLTAFEPGYLNRPRPASASSTPITPLLTERQREKVVKYINELAEDFELCVQTGSLACNYFDRYVATLVGSPTWLTADKRLIQMIASTCLLIASKFSDRKLPPLSELEKVHHGLATADEFAELELQILQALKWKLHVPLPHVFIEHLRTICAGAPTSTTIDDRVLFFVDLSVYGYHFLNYTPATIAAASILAAWKFSDEHENVSRYLDVLARAVSLQPHSLLGCVNALVRYYQSCFPEAAAKVEQKALFHLFTPIPPEKEVALTDLSVSISPNPLRPSDTPSPCPPSPGVPAPPTPTVEEVVVASKEQQQAQQQRYTPDSVFATF